MKIALMGTRGVPASYSGFETCVEELGSRLVQRGHEVTVYCRKHFITYPEDTYRGMRLIKLPTIENKYLDTIVHSLLSSLHALGKDYDVVLYFIAGNSLVTWIPRLTGKKVLLNVDGLDWKREKWPAPAKTYIRFAERMAKFFPNAVITDNKIIQEYYRNAYKCETIYISYGANELHVEPGRYIEQFGLEPDEYILFVGRLVPENCAHHLVKAFERLNTSKKCVIIGDAPYVEDYIASLKSTTNPNIIFTGYLFGDGYKELSSNSSLFVETSKASGTHPALLEAMAFGRCCVVNNTPSNLVTVGDAGYAYEGEEGEDALAPLLQRLIDNPDLVREAARKALERVRTVYSWDRIADDYEALFRKLTGKV